MINARATWWGKRVLAWFAAGVVVSLVIGVGAALTHRWVRNEQIEFYWRTYLPDDLVYRGFFSPISPSDGMYWKMRVGPLLRTVESERMSWARSDARRFQETVDIREPSVRNVYLGGARPPSWSMAAEYRGDAGGGASRQQEIWSDVAYGWPREVVASRWVWRPPASGMTFSFSGPNGRRRGSVDGAFNDVRLDAPVLPKWLERALGDAAQDVPGRVLWSGLAVSGVVWGGMLAGVWYGVVLAIAGVRRWRRRNAGTCLKCGYSREGLAVGVVCPECGGWGWWA